MSKVMIASKTLASLGTEIAGEAARIKDKVIGTVEEGVNSGKAAMKRVSKRGCALAEDLLDEAAYRVKRHPIQSVGITLGIGLAAGIAIGWLAGRKR